MPCLIIKPIIALQLTLNCTHLAFSTLSVGYLADILVNITFSRTTKIARLIFKVESSELC